MSRPATTHASKKPRIIPPGPRRRHPAALIVAAAALVAVLFAACSGAEDEPLPGPPIERPTPAGDPRTVRLGLAALPSDPSIEGFIDAVATAARHADTVLISRTPPWPEFLPGGKVSEETASRTRLETRLIEQYEPLELFFAIDPTDGAVQRSRIANLPAGIEPRDGFRDVDLRTAFLGYVAYVATNYKPDYLAIGVEINMLAERNPEQFEAFLTLYREAYAVARAASPDTLIFPTFQLEDLEGNLGEAHSPHWELLARFAGVMDALAVSTYPYLGDLRTASELRPDYYRQLSTRFEGPVIIAESAYPSSPVAGEPTLGTEEDQQAFIQRLLQDAEQERFRLVVYLAANDSSLVGGASSVLRDVGLRHADGSPKLAWGAWEAFARRPLER